MKAIYFPHSLFFFFFSLFPCTCFCELPLGQIPPFVTLCGDSGGRTDGSCWNSGEIKGKVFTFFYIDPDERDLNEEAFKALERTHIPDEKYGSVAVINLAATIWPDWLMGSVLKSKQKEYPQTLYVKDKKSVLVRAWHLQDHSSDILVFNKEGKTVFSKDGKLSQKEIEQLIMVIKQSIAE
jgi:hypothetical protein